MNILHLLSQNHLTGAEVYAATIAREQLRNFHVVYQVSNGFFYPSQALKIDLQVETKSKFTFIKNIFWLRKFIKKNKIDIVHAHSRAASKLAYWSTWGIPTALVSTVHGLQHSSFSKKLMNQYGELILCVCENIRSHLIRDFKYSDFKLKVLRNAIDPEKYVFSGAEPRHADLKLKIAVIGRTTGPKKERTEQIIQNLFDLKLNFEIEVDLIGGEKFDLAIGSDILNQLNEKKIQELKSSDLKSYDCIIGSGRVCMEALITGIPTIAFGEAAYIGLIRLAHFQNALFSNFGDIDLNSKGPQLNLQQFKADLECLNKNEIQEIELRQLSELALHEFSIKNIYSHLERIYQSALFIKKHPRWIPVLMYHKIPDAEIQTEHKIFVTKDRFEKHLQFFKSQGFKTITFNELSLFRSGEISMSQFPKKPLILTFDDGYKDNLENASPLLKKYNMKAQIFLLAESQISSNQWDHSDTEPTHEIVSGPDRQKWLNSAFEIGSHGFSHQRITLMNSEEASNELAESKKSLEKEFNQKVKVFAFTYGDTNLQASQMAQVAGYEYAVNTDQGGLHIEENPFQIFRVNIFPNETFLSLLKKTSSWYRRYYYWKRKK